jgi:hypothetical protein
MSPLRPFTGWTKIPSSLPNFFFFFFHLFSTPKFSPVLPTTYQPLPLTPSPELLAPETLSGSELGAWSRLGAGASLEFGAWSLEFRTSLELGATTAGPTQDPGKHFSLCCFFFVLQEKKKKKKAMASPSSSSLCHGACYSESSGACCNASSGASELLRSLHFFHVASSEPRRAPELAELQRAPELAATQALELQSFFGACISFM